MTVLASTVLAAHFLAGAILSWATPLVLLLIVGVYWGLLLRRRSAGARTGRMQ